MSSCECYRIGGPFIAEDPSCSVHGTEARQREEQAEAAREDLVEALTLALQRIQSLEARVEHLEGLLSVNT